MILSAKYGLVDPGQIIAPYDCTLLGQSRQARAKWGQLVYRQLVVLGLAEETFAAHAGKIYIAPLADKLRIEIPLAGLGIGCQAGVVRNTPGYGQNLMTTFCRRAIGVFGLFAIALPSRLPSFLHRIPPIILLEPQVSLPGQPPGEVHMHSRFAWAIGVVLIGATTIWAAAPRPADKVVEEIWESARLDGVKIGFVHTTVQTVAGDAKRLRTIVDLALTFRRHNAVMQLRMVQGDEETADGGVVGVFMRQFQDRRQKVALTGALEDDGRMHVLIDDGRIDRRLRWSKDIVGVHQLDHLFQDRKPAPSSHFAFPSYQPTLNAVVIVRVTVKDQEIVPLANGRKSLLRVELRPDKITAPGLTIQLPMEVWWLDGDFVPVRRQIELEGLGSVILTRTTRESAAVAGAGQLPDLNQKNLISLNRRIPRAYAAHGAVYRVTLRDDPDPQTALVSDGHQEVIAGKDGVLELHVHPVHPVVARSGDRATTGGAVVARSPDRATAARIAAKYLESCHFIDSDDGRIRELARKAAGSEKDPWKIALRIERWVKQNMRPDDGAALAPASQVSRVLRGDCRGYALLTAALCRAESLPARTAVGLIYVEKAGKPYFGFHMWTEVNIDGCWISLDGTLGRGGVGADHIKVADSSWHNVESLTPLLPVNRILGKTTIEIVSVEAGD